MGRGGGEDGETCVCNKDIPISANSQKNTGAGWLLFQKQLFVRNILSPILKENKNKQSKKRQNLHMGVQERRQK